jgi:hypothetical protein
MLPRYSKLVLVIALALLSTGARIGDFQSVASTDQAWHPEGAHLTLGAALKIAEAEAHRKHVTLSSFQPPWFRYEYAVYHPDSGDGYYVWAFSYEGKVRAPGNYFLIIVDDLTKHAEFVPGH